MPRPVESFVRRTVACLLAAATALTVAACQKPNANLTQADVKAQTLAYLQAKYARPFEIASVKWGEPWVGPLNLDGKQTTVYAFATGENPNLLFMVDVVATAAPLTFHDFYVVQRVAPTYESQAQAAAEKVFPGAMVAVYEPGQRGFPAPPDTMRADTTFDQFKAWADSNYDIEFCVTFPLADGQDDAAVKAKKPQLIAALSGIARRGSVAGHRLHPGGVQQRPSAAVAEGPGPAHPLRQRNAGVPGRVLRVLASLTPPP